MRAPWKWIVPAVLLLLGAVCAAAYALLWTTRGASWLVRTAARAAPFPVEVREVSGRLVDELRLGHVSARWSSGTATVDSLTLRLRPLSLLGGAVSFESLAVEGASATFREGAADERGEPPAPLPDLRWPAVTGTAVRLEGRIDALRLSRIRVVAPRRDPVTLEGLSARVAWRDGVLAISDLAADLPSVRFAGSLSAGFARPALRADLSARLAQGPQGLETVSLSASLAPSRVPGGLAGPVRLEAKFPEERRVRLEGNADLATNRAALRNLSLSLPEQPGAVTGGAEAILSGGRMHAELSLAFHELDLFFAAGTRTEISGELALSGGPEGYRGSYSLRNAGPGVREVRLRGKIVGDFGKVSIPRLEGTWLGGDVAGAVALSFGEALQVEGSLQGRNLDPARLDPGWRGRVSFALQGRARKQGDSPIRAEIDARLLESTLRGRTVSGEARARTDGADLQIARLELHGDGFDISARGALGERLAFSAEIPRLAGLLPGAKGSVSAAGWIRWREGPAGGAVTARATEVTFRDTRAESLSLTATWEGGDHPFAAKGSAQGVTVGVVRLDAAVLEADGTLEEHAIRASIRAADGEAHAIARGRYRSGAWEGTVASLSAGRKGYGTWSLAAPARLAASSEAVKIAPFRATGPGGGAVEAAADLSLGPLQGTVEARWRNVDLSLFAPWMQGAQLEGASSGDLLGRWREDGRIALTGRAELSGAMLVQGRRLEVESARFTLDAGEDGTRFSLDASLGRGGTVTGRFVSPEPARTGVPRRGSASARWQGVDLAPFSSWIPAGVTLAGTVSGRVEGELLPGGRFDARAEAAVADGKLAWRNGGKAIEAPLRSADLRCTWSEESVRGDFSFSLEEYGRAQGNFGLPLPAALPLAMRPEGKVSAALSATFQEKGLLPAFFPGMLQESSGTVALDLRVGGTWDSPEWTGTATLSDAGAYLPSAGIHLTAVKAKVVLAGHEIRIESLSARSGDGSVDGRATIRLAGWTMAGYQATLKGKDFRAVSLPEFRMTASPDLSIEGTSERLEVRGEITVPDLLIYGRQTPPPVRRSEDVVIVDAGGASGKEGPTVSLDIEVKVVLGKHVLVKAEGIDARLEGTVTLRTERDNEVVGQGEIRVAEGRYSTYGVRLQITRGRLLFAGGPVDRPTLDIVATRTAGEVKAGVQVGGTPRQPVVTLYSEPAMPDTDVLSYVVLGRPLGQQKGNGEQADALMLAAGALLPMAESTVLRDRLGRHFGIDVLEVKTGEDVETGSAVTVGKYLNPNLYVSYGRSIFTGANEFTARYDFLKRWQIESRYGEESGVDLYYKIEFR